MGMDNWYWYEDVVGIGPKLHRLSCRYHICKELGSTVDGGSISSAQNIGD